MWLRMRLFFKVVILICSVQSGFGFGNNSILFEYGVDLLFFIQKPGAKEFLIQAVKNQKCAEHISWFYDNLENFTDDGMWAIKMIDASAKIPSGLFQINMGGWMGSFDECLDIKSTKKDVRGNYCLGTLYSSISSLDETDQYLRKAQLFTTQKQSFQQAYPIASFPSFGICVPDGCSADDLESVITALELKINMPFQCQTIDDANPPLDGAAWAGIGFFLVFIVLMVSSTSYDVYCKYYNKEPTHVLLLSFSVYTNGQQLFRVSKNSTDLSCLHGLRFLSMVWVIILHTISVMMSGPLSNAIDVLKYLDTTQSMIFANAGLSVDTFMVLTGLLVVYGFMNSKYKGQKFHIIIFYLHRYLRLTPPFLAVVIVSMTLLKYMGSGPHWSFIVDYFQGLCKTSWWSSLLYIQNYVDVKQWCVGQTWYLNIDWQIYLFSPIFLFALFHKPIIGVSLVFLLMLVFIIIPFYVTWTNYLPALITNLYGDIVGFQNLYYLRTHTRAAPWFVGALVGYYISKNKFERKTNSIKINKVLLLVTWLSVLTLILVCIFVGHDDLTSKEYNRLSNAFYNSLVRPSWAFCIAWIIYACVNGYGGIINMFLSLPLFQVLGRFTYSMYLLHVTMLYMITYARKVPAYFSMFNVVYSFWGIFMISFALSIFWVLAFETPILIIEKYFLNKYYARQSQQKKQPHV